MLLVAFLSTIPSLNGYQNVPLAPVNLTSSLPFLYKYPARNEAPNGQIQQTIMCHYIRKVVLWWGAVGGSDVRGSGVDYHKMKHQLRRPDTSPLGSRH